MSHEVPPYSSTRLTAALGIALSIMLTLMFASGAFFFLFVFNYDLPPWFTAVRFFHFYTGLLSIPILIGKYGATFVRFGGYYLRVPRFKAAGPPSLVPRVLSPLLAADFFVLYFSGLYMLFHYYYTVTNIWPFEAKPVQVHLWAAIIGAPLITVHLVWHFTSAMRSVRGRAATIPATARYGEDARGRMTRRALLGTLLGSGAALAFAFQNTGLRSLEVAHLFIGRIPDGLRGGPGDFPSETLFGVEQVHDVSAYRLEVGGAVDQPLHLTYDEISKLPSYEYRIRLSCVSGWTQQVVWRGPRVRDVLALARERAGVRSVYFHSMTNYGVAWHRERLNVDEALLATHQNGAPLFTEHGFPVRLIIPGYPGQSMVKQIDRIEARIDDEPFSPDFRIVEAQGDGCGVAVA